MIFFILTLTPLYPVPSFLTLNPLHFTLLSAFPFSCLVSNPWHGTEWMTAGTNRFRVTQRDMSTACLWPRQVEAERSTLAIWRWAYVWCGVHSHNWQLGGSEIDRAGLTPFNEKNKARKINVNRELTWGGHFKWEHWFF